MSAADAIASTQERTNRSLRAQEKRDERTEKTVIRILMASADGRRYIWNDLAKSHIFEQVIIPGQPEVSAMREGRRLKGLQLLLLVTELCPQQYITMTQENARVKLAQEEENEDERSTDTDS